MKDLCSNCPNSKKCHEECTTCDKYERVKELTKNAKEYYLQGDRISLVMNDGTIHLLIPLDI